MFTSNWSARVTRLDCSGLALMPHDEDDDDGEEMMMMRRRRNAEASSLSSASNGKPYVSCYYG